MEEQGKKESYPELLLTELSPMNDYQKKKKIPVKPLCVLNVLCLLETFFPIEFSFIALQECEVEGLNMKTRG